MSIQLPVLEVSSKHHISDSTGNTIEFRLHDNKLYVMKIGETIEGGELILDPLPISAQFGAGGNSTNTVLETSVTTQANDMSEINQADVEDAMVELTGADSAVLTGTAAGSLILKFDLIFETGTDASILTTALTAAQDSAQIQSAFQAKGGVMAALAVTASSAVQVTKTVSAKILSATFTSGDPSTVAITTLGPFAEIQHKLSTESVWRTITGASSGESTTPAGMSFTVNFRLRNNEGGVLATKDIDINLLPATANVFAFDNTVQSDDGTFTLPAMASGSYSFSSVGDGRDGRVALVPRGIFSGGPFPYTIAGLADELSFSVWINITGDLNCNPMIMFGFGGLYFLGAGGLPANNMSIYPNGPNGEGFVAPEDFGYDNAGRNSWHHMTFASKRDVGVRYCFDGVVKAEYSGDLNWGGWGDTFNVHSFQFNNRYDSDLIAPNMKIQDLKFYSTYLTAEESSTIYNAG